METRLKEEFDEAHIKKTGIANQKRIFRRKIETKITKKEITDRLNEFSTCLTEEIECLNSTFEAMRGCIDARLEEHGEEINPIGPYNDDFIDFIKLVRTFDALLRRDLDLCLHASDALITCLKSLNEANQPSLLSRKLKLQLRESINTLNSILDLYEEIVPKLNAYMQNNSSNIPDEESPALPEIDDRRDSQPSASASGDSHGTGSADPYATCVFRGAPSQPASSNTSGFDAYATMIFTTRSSIRLSSSGSLRGSFIVHPDPVVSESSSAESNLNQEQLPASTRVSSTPVEEEETLPNPSLALRDDLVRQIALYLEWRDNKSKDDGRGYQLGWFTRVRHFTEAGKIRANTLLNNLNALTEVSSEEIINLLQEHLSHDSKLHNHSLDTYLLETMMNHHDVLGIAGIGDNERLAKGNREGFRDYFLQMNSAVNLI
jgi:hypothetical protein